MSRAERDFVFGYGSLVRRGNGIATEDVLVCRLGGFRRAWDVAMDNARDLPGYKYYVDRETGERPPVYVAFLSIRPEAGSAVNGVAYAVEHDLLPLLDARERNYERREVTGVVDVDLGGRVWAYVGTTEARERYAAGREQGTAYVSEEYHDGVRDDFGRLGADALAEFERTTDELEVPCRALERVDLPRDVSANGRHALVRGVV